jgi:hypothetical protein
VVALPALLVIGRFLLSYAQGDGDGHLQSLVLAGALLAIAMILAAVGVLAHLIAVNRDLLQDIRARQLQGLRPVHVFETRGAVDAPVLEP